MPTMARVNLEVDPSSCPIPQVRPLEEASALAFSLTSASREAESEASG